VNSDAFLYLPHPSLPHIIEDIKVEVNEGFEGKGWVLLWGVFWIVLFGVLGDEMKRNAIS
jgi:hypothetical protein